MPNNDNPNYRYFLFSTTQLNNKKVIEAKIGKEYSPGTVLVGTSYKQFTEIVEDVKKASFADAIIVSQGDITQMKYKK